METLIVSQKEESAHLQVVSLLKDRRKKGCQKTGAKAPEIHKLCSKKEKKQKRLTAIIEDNF